MSALAPLAMGIAFGVALNQARLTERERIVGVYRLSDLTVLKFLLSAILVGSVAVQGARSLGLAASVPAPPMFFLANAVGGVLFGMAMAGAGFCSGTILASAGSGGGVAVAGALGLIAGALAMDAGWARAVAVLRSWGPHTQATVAELLGVSPWLVVLILAASSLWLFYVLERRHSTQPSRASTANAASKAA